ncbi:MAG TPA: PEP-CTERM sorting domain-containing protein, partial [Sphingomonas sp.]|nr:PEP-CTERM sorting domain-containing protein [Sphingomonas sp.]
MTISMRKLALAGCAALALFVGNAASAKTILFVGNSFTQGAHSPVRAYRPDLVTDLNGTGIGGVPALFKTFAEESGLDFTVSLETEGGKGLEFHYATRRQLIDHAWDVVVLQGLSTLDRKNPGDPTIHVENAALLAAMFKRANPAAEIDLVSTWSRADQTYLSTGHWHGRPITAMADDLAAASRLALQRSRDIKQAVPVGAAWNRAIAEKVADANPYDGTTFGQVDLWTYDQYHASIYGYYLEALVVFGQVTGVDP